MNENFYFIWAFIAGAALGILFFGGLWLTVKKTVTIKNPAILLLGSMLLRTGITLVGFYYISQGDWQRLLICLAGFIAARFIVIRFTKLIETKQMHLNKEDSHES